MRKHAGPKFEALPVAFATADGLTLAGECRNPQGAPTVLFVHGFGQVRQAWAGSADALASTGLRCVGFDLRGHGQSDRVANGDYHLDAFVDDLAAVAAAQPAPPVLVGASMGGLLGLALAGERTPPPFAALVLVDITPSWESAGVQRILGFMRAHPDGFADHAAAAAAIASYLPHRAGRRSAAQLEPLLRRGDDGRLRWHWDPAMLAPIADEAERHQPRLAAAARRVEVPVLLLSGGRSDVVSHANVDEFLQLVPHAQHVELPHATHMLAGDANDAFTHEIERFIDTLHPTNHR
ncbi:MAG TPA: alpha/beta hydrolase [Rhodanobacteraceae bacterium]|nr:alpha/beta hydrolase [Rhodanobacteraceae bacterium]